jgi:hypothetical protein
MPTYNIQRVADLNADGSLLALTVRPLLTGTMGNTDPHVFISNLARQMVRGVIQNLRRTGFQGSDDDAKRTVTGRLEITNLNNQGSTFHPSQPISLSACSYTDFLFLLDMIQQSNNQITVFDVEWRFQLNPGVGYLGGSNPRIPFWLGGESNLKLAKFKPTWQTQTYNEQIINCAAFVIAYNLTPSTRRSQPWELERIRHKAYDIQTDLGWGPLVSFQQILYSVNTHFKSYRFTILRPAFNSHSEYTLEGPDWKFETTPSGKLTSECNNHTFYFVHDNVTGQEHYGGCSPKQMFDKHRAGGKWCHRCVTYFQYRLGCECTERINHKKLKESRVRACLHCNKFTCDGHCTRNCRNCKTDFKGGYDPEEGEGHRCFLFDDSEPKQFGVEPQDCKNPMPLLWAYDVESSMELLQEELTEAYEMDGDKFKLGPDDKVIVTTVNAQKHVVNLVIARNVFSNEEKVYFGADCLNRFIYDMNTINGGHNVCVAHNGSGYDSRLIFAAMLAMSDKPEKIQPICRGSKIIQLKYGKHLVFRDSLLFLPSSLASLAKGHNLPMKKGTFPHLFNTIENYNYNGPLPPKEKFTLTFSAKSQKDIDTFNEWYRERSLRYYLILIIDLGILDKNLKSIAETMSKFLRHSFFHIMSRTLKCFNIPPGSLLQAHHMSTQFSSLLTQKLSPYQMIWILARNKLKILHTTRDGRFSDQMNTSLLNRLYAVVVPTYFEPTTNLNQKIFTQVEALNMLMSSQCTHTSKSNLTTPEESHKSTFMTKTFILAIDTLPQNEVMTQSNVLANIWKKSKLSLNNLISLNTLNNPQRNSLKHSTDSSVSPLTHQKTYFIPF